MTVEHEHDWRVDPHTHYADAMASRRLVCADCGLSTTVPTRAPEMTSRDPRDWPKYEGGPTTVNAGACLGHAVTG